MIAREFLRRAKALARRRRCELSTISRTVFPGNARALDRLERALIAKKGGPGVVEFEEAIPRLEALESETERERGC